MARYSTEHKRETRTRILAAADRLMRARGSESASVEAVMRTAGLTVGGFYAHFASKDVLAQEALLYGLESSMDRLLSPLAAIADDREWVRALIWRYLRQVDDPGLDTACPLTLLLPEVARGDGKFRAAFAERTGALLDRVERRFPAAAGLTAREVAIAVFASCAGAVALARTIPASHARERILHAVETMLVSAFGLDAADPAAPATGGLARRARVRSRRAA
jgi:TetR/AcrR family transcriptional repressor of nem operon